MVKITYLVKKEGRMTSWSWYSAEFYHLTCYFLLIPGEEDVADHVGFGEMLP